MDTTVNNQAQTGICPKCGKQFPQKTGTCPFDGSPLNHELPDPMIGTMLPRNYRITGKLGRGAMSVVYSGVYEPLNQPVAIKILKSHLVSDQSTFKRFQQEAKTAGALEHENIVGILDFGVTDQGVPYLIMELLEGESLTDRLRRSRGLSLDAVISLFSQAADALQYTHERGVIHRDVKPSNILIVHEEGMAKLKIVDFGIAKMQTTRGPAGALDLTATGEVFGTPLYVSPEQAMGRTLDCRADIYSLGCVMYEAVAGQPAFSGTTAFDVIRMQVSDDPIPLGAVRPDLKIPPSLALAVTKSMSKVPASRYQTMSELLEDLQKARMELNSETRESSSKGLSTVKSTGKSDDKLGPLVVSQRAKTAPVSAAGSKQFNVLLLPLLMAGVSGLLAGALILFAFDFTEKMTQSQTKSTNDHRMVVGDTRASLPQRIQVMDPQAVALGKSAHVQYEKGNYGAAEAQCKKAIEITSSKGQKLGSAILLSELCSIYTAHNNLPAALDAGQKAVAVLQKADASRKADLAIALRSLGIVHYYLHQPAKAEPLLKQAWQIDQEICGPISLACAIDLSNLARAEEDNKNFDRAEDHYKESIAISEKVYGRSDPRLAERIENLAAFLAKRNRQVEARTLERRAKHLASDK